jgi:hypothetical protein
MKRRIKFFSEGSPVSEQFIVDELKVDRAPLHIRSQRLWISNPLMTKSLAEPYPDEPKARKISHIRRSLIRKSLRSKRKLNKPMPLKRGIDFTVKDIRYLQGVDEFNDIVADTATFGYDSAKLNHIEGLRISIRNLRFIKGLVKNSFNKHKIGILFYRWTKYFVSSHLRRLLWIRRSGLIESKTLSETSPNEYPEK